MIFKRTYLVFTHEGYDSEGLYEDFYTAVRSRKSARELLEEYVPHLKSGTCVEILCTKTLTLSTVSRTYNERREVVFLSKDLKKPNLNLEDRLC